MNVRKVGLIGAGVIGAGWAARLVLNGIDVALYDPDPEVERKVGEVLANAERAYRKLTLAPLPRRGSVTFARSVEEAVADADFVQESAPEREDLKIRLLAQVDRACRPDVVIGTSTSGLLPTRLQSGMAHPERFTVGHPFNPVYLLPLVEICGGERTSEATKERAATFYRSIGMKPLMLRKEIDGFIADRLMEALWREALHLVNDDVATVEEIDDAVRFGCGLRWSFMGTFLVYRIAGGEAGMRHFMAQFGPALKLPWTKLEAPELTDELLEKIVAQSDAQAGDRSIRELERLRDDCLVSVMQGLRSHHWGAGEVLAAYEEKLYEASHAHVMGAGDDLAQPLRLHEARVLPEWIDYNGHMTESRYLQVFGDASDALFRYVGIDEAYHRAGLSYYTVETHIMHLREVEAGVPLHVTTQILGADEKRIHLFHSLHRSDDGTRLATAEQMLLHVDTNAGRACPAREDVRERVLRIAAAHRDLPRPDFAGRQVGAPRR
ncbi:carnitine 3-dehydrogenase [Benzoatithermus flavus]|uniref:L-carnitine dehydrogenase n=1 Tax=Benzoatithermus flavus TaxID=3108223 RepID=A0ABU8XUQ2_9PROT